MAPGTGVRNGQEVRKAMKNTIRVLQLQTIVQASKKDNLENLRALLKERFEKDAPRPDLVTLGEMFTCPYETKNFPVYAEEQDGESVAFLSCLAKEYGIFLSAGSIPEKDREGHVYNSAFVFNPDGHVLAKHQKLHLFDINVRGGQAFRESDTLTPGDSITVFDTPFGKMGLCICFDARFPELFRAMVLQGARMILVPAAFNLTTGPAHWEILFRQRAVDNQCFVIATSPARDLSASYHAYGHSMVTDPWGRVVSEMDEKKGEAETLLDLSEIDAVREQLPLLSARRTDLYQPVSR